MRLLSRLSVLLPLFAVLAAGCGSTGSDSGETGTSNADTEHVAWSYEGENGPEHWNKLDEEYELCENGSNQSPVNLADATRSPFPRITTDYRPEHIEIEDNGHAIEAQVEDSKSSITIAGTRYQLEQFHFHIPSEETIEGRRYPASLHMVHISDDGQIAVVGAMVQPGEPNEALTFETPAPDGEFEAEAEIDPNHLIPDDRTAYRYEGSLTTPPCTEGVTWTVFRQPITMAAEKFNAIRSIHNDNSRPIQPIGQRKILFGPALAR